MTLFVIRRKTNEKTKRNNINSISNNNNSNVNTGAE